MIGRVKERVRKLVVVRNEIDYGKEGRGGVGKGKTGVGCGREEGTMRKKKWEGE